MEEILKDKNKIRKIIIKELKDVIKNYAQPRKTLISEYTEQDIEIIDDTPDYPVNIFISASGYFKKITPQSLRMSSEHKLKEGDYISQNFETTNKTELIFFTNKYRVYKSKASAFDDTKASLIGDYIPAKLSFEEDESLKILVPTVNYDGYMIFFFENGKATKVPLNTYETKTNRKKLTKAYSDKSPLVDAIYIPDDCEILLRSSNGHALVFNTSLLTAKTTRDSQGVQVMSLRKNAILASAEKVSDEDYEKFSVKNIPSAGKQAKELGDANQLKF